MKDFYKILQVDRGAEPEVVEGAYRRLARKYHPDVNTDPSAALRMRDINEAYEVLSNPAGRLEYDRKWYSHAEPNERGPGEAARKATDPWAETAPGYQPSRSTVREGTSDNAEAHGAWIPVLVGVTLGLILLSLQNRSSVKVDLIWLEWNTRLCWALALGVLLGAVATTGLQGTSERGLASRVFGAALRLAAASALVAYALANLQTVYVHMLWFDWRTAMFSALFASALLGSIATLLASTIRGRRRVRTAQTR